MRSINASEAHILRFSSCSHTFPPTVQTASRHLVSFSCLNDEAKIPRKVLWKKNEEALELWSSHLLRSSSAPNRMLCSPLCFSPRMLAHTRVSTDTLSRRGRYPAQLLTSVAGINNPGARQTARVVCNCVGRVNAGSERERAFPRLV